ncbi:hypothetical protein D3C86_2011410 [compost metagenome]
MHPAARVHVFLLCPEGAAHMAVGVQLAVKGTYHHVEGVMQVIGLPAGELAFGDCDFRDHADYAFFPILRCSI